MTRAWTPQPSAPSPVVSTGVLGWMKKNLFSSVGNTLLTLLGLSILLVIIPPFVKWALVDATWLGNSRECCDEAAANGQFGACWTFVKVRMNMFLYGFYPEEHQWRVNFTMLALLFQALPILLPDLFNRAVRIAFNVLTAGTALLLFGPVPMVLIAAFALLPLLLGRLSISGRVPQVPFDGLGGLATRLGVAALAGLAGGALCSQLGGDPVASLVGVLTGLLLWILLQFPNVTAAAWRWILLFTAYPLLAYIMLMGDAFGLPMVETHYWGGLFLTLVVSVTGMGTALPIGILLALGRRSTLPVIRTVSIGFIEFARGVPLVSVLFMASVMFPLLLPEDVTFNKLLRALIGIAFFYAAYMAEVVRGGLQAIPAGQYEAAKALGWPYWRMMGKIILPQTLRLVIPGLANNFLSLLKDTTLVAVIGLFDLLGIAKAAMADADWLGFTKESYLFAAAIFWVMCFGMSRYFLYLEKKYHTSYH